MLTPFAATGSVDFEGLDALTEWYINCGVEGLFSVCASSEMFHLTNEERLAVARRVCERTAGRVPVFASGTFGGSVREQAAFVKQMADTGVDGVVVVASQMADKDGSETDWIAAVGELLDRTDDIPLGLYECPRPYHRLLESETLAWCAGTGRFVFSKDTSCRESAIRAKIDATRGTALRFYDACAATLLLTLESGGDGFCGIAANFYADLYVWLCRHFADDPETARDLYRFLSVAERAIGVGYPASAKLWLQRAGLPIRTDCRVKDVTFDERDLRILSDLEALVADWRMRVGSPIHEVTV